MAAFPNFVPTFGGGAVLTAAGTSSFATMAAFDPDVRLYNAATVPVYVRWGVAANGTVTAGATDLALAPGAIEVFSKGKADTIAVLSSGASGSVYAITGNGA